MTLRLHWTQQGINQHSKKFKNSSVQFDGPDKSPMKVISIKQLIADFSDVETKRKNNQKENALILMSNDKCTNCEVHGYLSVSFFNF